MSLQRGFTVDCQITAISTAPTKRSQFHSNLTGCKFRTFTGRGYVIQIKAGLKRNSKL